MLLQQESLQHRTLLHHPIHHCREENPYLRGRAFFVKNSIFFMTLIIEKMHFVGSVFLCPQLRGNLYNHGNWALNFEKVLMHLIQISIKLCGIGDCSSDSATVSSVKLLHHVQHPSENCENITVLPICWEMWNYFYSLFSTKGYRNILMSEWALRNTETLYCFFLFL